MTDNPEINDQTIFAKRKYLLKINLNKAKFFCRTTGLNWLNHLWLNSTAIEPIVLKMMAYLQDKRARLLLVALVLSLIDNWMGGKRIKNRASEGGSKGWD